MNTSVKSKLASAVSRMTITTSLIAKNSARMEIILSARNLLELHDLAEFVEQAMRVQGRKYMVPAKSTCSCRLVIRGQGVTDFSRHVLASGVDMNDREDELRIAATWSPQLDSGSKRMLASHIKEIQAKRKGEKHANQPF